jgi:hypothetical protein
MHGAFSNFDSIPIKTCVVTKLRNRNSYNLSKKEIGIVITLYYLLFSVITILFLNGICIL